jgi:hypothetical protein
MMRICAALSIVALCAAWLSAEEKKVPLETELPEEVLAGTPPDVLALLFPGLEKLPEGDAPEFLVPEGTGNVALNKPVTSSDSNPVLGELKFVTDGQKEGTEENYVELGPMEQWVQIDLGKPCTIYALYIWHYFREARSYRDVVIQVAADADFTENVQTIYSNDQDNSLKKGLGKSRPWIETYRGKLIDANGAQGRFVRLYSAGNTANDLNHYVEVEVYGKPAT